MSLRDALAKLLVRPVWVAGPPKVEEWRCPACDATVVRISPALKGIWFTAEPGELRALCARQYGVHDRDGRRHVAEPGPVVELADLAAAAPGTHWIPLLCPGDACADGFVVLVAPAGLAFIPDGEFLVVHELEQLAASQLIGPLAPPLSGRVLGRIEVGDLVFDRTPRATALDASCLAPLLDRVDRKSVVAT